MIIYAPIPANKQYNIAGINVFRIMSPSFPVKPTTVDAATTLCTQIIFPAAAPMI